MSSDLRALKKHFIPNSEKCNNTSTYDPTEELKGVFKANGVTYTIKNEAATFSDGKTGFVIFSPQQGEWSFKTNDHVSDKRYIDVYYAAEALYNHLTTR